MDVLSKGLCLFSNTPPPPNSVSSHSHNLTASPPSASFSGRLFSLLPRFRHFLFALFAALAFGLPLAAQAATVNINVAADWPAGGTITLNDGDVLNIAAAAGSPAIPTVIQLAANASVTINGSGAMITNLHIQDGADTAAHNVSINNLHITSDITGYLQAKGVLVLTGANEIAGTGGAHGITSPGTLTITSATGGTLKASSDSATGIYVAGAGTLNIEGNADVTVASATGRALNMDAASNAINVAAGAKLTTTSGTGTAIGSTVGSLAIACNGTLTASGNAQGIYASGQSVSITGSGTVSATGTNGLGIFAASLSVDKATVNATSANSAGLAFSLDVGNVTLTHGATLNLTGSPSSPVTNATGFTLDAGSSVTLTKGAGGAATESHPFTMSAAGTWQLSGSAAFVAPATATSSPATISVAAGASGTIKLGPASSSGGGGTAVPTLGEWALWLLALLLGGAALTMRRRV